MRGKKTDKRRDRILIKNFFFIVRILSEANQLRSDLNLHGIHIWFSSSEICKALLSVAASLSNYFVERTEKESAEVFSLLYTAGKTQKQWHRAVWSNWLIAVYIHDSVNIIKNDMTEIQRKAPAYKCV